MVLGFENGAAAHLFITWAADLAVYDETKNDREHTDIWYMVSDRGWHVTVEGGQVKASREGEVKTWPVERIGTTAYDRFVESVEAGEAPPWDIADAWKDIAIMEQATASPGCTVQLDLEPGGTA
jgi:hypothetical protein